MYKRILLAYDGSEAGQKALLDCHDLAQWGQSELFLIAAMPLPIDFGGMEVGVYNKELEYLEKQKYQAVLDDGLRRLAQSGHSARGEVVIGDSTDVITREAVELEVDLIVVGHKHLDSWAARWWRGSVSKALIEKAPCNVLVVIT